LRAALAWLVFAIAFWVFGPYFNYSPAGALDPWISVGYFLNFDDLVARYGFPYYVSRIPFILTGLAFYGVFAPHVANFALHTFYLWLACLGLYGAAAGPFGKPAAIVATVAFAFSTYTATAMAWDYPNGSAIAFVMLGLWLTLAPPGGMSDRVRWIAVGFLWAIAGTNNLLALLVILPCCLMVLHLAEFSLTESARRTGLILTGVGLMLVSFGIVAKWLFGTFLFLGPQIGLIVHAMTTPGYLANMWGTGYEWIATAYRYAALLGLCLGALAVLAATARRADKTEYKIATAVIGMFALSLCAFAFVEFVLQGVVLRVAYTSVYLVAPAYLALAAALGLLMREWPLRARSAIVAIGVLLVAAIPFAVTSVLAWTSRDPAGPWLLQAIPIVLVLTGLLLPGGVLRRSAAILAALALVTLPALATTADGRLYWVFRSGKSTFEAAVAVSDVLRSGVTKGRTVRFWFDLDEPHSYVFLSLGALYLPEWRGLRNLPKWSEQEVRNNLPDNTLLVHLTSDPDKLDAREAQLAKHGIKFGPRRAIPIRASGDTEFFLVLKDISGHSSPAPADNSTGGRQPDAAQILDSVK
jgi:hypothetical protein